MSAQKVFISAQQLEQDCWNFAIDLHKKGHDFDWIIGVTRGGAQISIYIQEAFSCLTESKKKFGLIHASSYSAIGKAGGVVLGNVDPIVLQICDHDKILVIDDVFDRGRTLDEVKRCLDVRLSAFHVELKVGALYYKPESSEVDMVPDFHLKTYQKSDWLVFPHELCGLSPKERKAKGFPV